MAETVVFLHGFLGHPQEFEQIVEKLKGSFECISIDLNQNSSFDLKAQAEFVKKKIEQFNISLNVSKAHFWGYSMGGRVLLEFYKQYPNLCKSLTLESVSLGLTDPKTREKRILSDSQWAELIAKDKNLFLEKWYSQSLFDNFRTRSDFAVYLSLRKKHLSPIHSQMLVEASPGANSAYFDLIDDIKVPTLALVGQFDQKYLENWGKLIDKPTPIAIEIIKNSGHVIHLENPLEAVEIFQKFIKAKSS